MLECSECKKAYDVDKLVIWQGKVLCRRCALSLLIHLLENANAKLIDITKRLSSVIEALDHEPRQTKESKG
jgi:hypothetical protein